MAYPAEVGSIEAQDNRQKKEETMLSLKMRAAENRAQPERQP
jgi:hypothetical protein